MPRNNWLKTLGLYLHQSFLEPELCLEIAGQMAAAPGEQASVYTPDGVSVVKPEMRATLSVDVPSAVDAALRERFARVRPHLETHFGVTLMACEEPNYLVYGPGAFFRAHQDSRPGSQSGTAGRIVSAVIFLNRSQPAGAADYDGGEFRLFKLVADPQWDDVGFVCDAEPGLLLAFRSDTIHEVTPVTRGRRCTIATWFR
jgi:SM-20-related protein